MVVRRALLISVLFLLEETVFSQSDPCAGDLCYEVFLKAADFSGAKKDCEESGGQLFHHNLEQAEKTLACVPRGIGGRFWLSGTNRTDPQLCSFVTVTMGGNPTLSWTPCPAKLDGFLCQYTLENHCSSLHVHGGAKVRYVTHPGCEASGSNRFPLGTIAVAETPGGKYLDSKHVCIDGSWMQAPWNCEVMKGGCEHGCNDITKTCFCPAKQILHPNNITCSKDACADCAQGCHQQGDSHECVCTAGYRQAKDRKSCVDVDECKETNPCTGEGEECVNTQGSFMCQCKREFIEEDGVCVNISICDMCEHMLCEKSNGVYGCKCRKGFRVSPHDPTMCEQHCAERDCPARCILNSDVKKEDMQQCFCPEGYIRDTRDGETICTDIDECEFMAICNHKCENVFGSFKCLCDEGYTLRNGYQCVPTEMNEEDDGSGSSPSLPTPGNTHQATVPSYIKAGSVLGITMFMLLCTGLLCFLVRNIAKRCGKFELSSLKGPDIDIYYLQQVTTDTYKRLSFDKQSKTDSQ
ncbi:thrombomodulin-like [Anabas testudineus]|uniref:thrombomodulin-like n=1 Tax=Anabas testudineus TaxID=64144 RepID=UPI000E457641|nr:thrombomodulin-like [Anabas testudineus]